MEAVGTLAGGIAHDFNNILQAISGYIELLLAKEKKDRSSLRHLSEIDRAVQRAAELVQQLLTFSRKVDPELKPINLNNIVRQSVKMLERTIPKMIGIEIRLSDDLKTIKSDPIQLEQVLMNIGANAMDAMPQGGELVISTENVTLDENFCNLHIGSKAGDYVRLSISDTGHGMEEETIKHIFDPFYTTKEIGQGTGLGLAMVYGIVKSHDGYILCDSKPGQGTIFSIYLPVSRTEHVSDVLLSRDPGVVLGGSETILLVDDDEAVVEIASDILKENGYRILTADCGEKALSIHEENADGIDLVILDLGMPGMGGQGCLEKLLTVNPSLKVIIASGYSADAQVKDALDYGAKDFLGKPYRLVDLLRKVRQVLDAEELSAAS
jgi:CheY-like chemotaxis protein